MYYFSSTYGNVLARSLCIILFSTWRYCVHTSTRSRSVPRVNYVSLFLYMTTKVIHTYENYIFLLSNIHTKIVFNTCDLLYLGHISSMLATKNWNTYMIYDSDEFWRQDSLNCKISHSVQLSNVVLLQYILRSWERNISFICMNVYSLIEIMVFDIV